LPTLKAPTAALACLPLNAHDWSSRHERMRPRTKGALLSNLTADSRAAGLRCACHGVTDRSTCRITLKIALGEAPSLPRGTRVWPSPVLTVGRVRPSAPGRSLAGHPVSTSSPVLGSTPGDSQKPRNQRRLRRLRHNRWVQIELGVAYQAARSRVRVPAPLPIEGPGSVWLSGPCASGSSGRFDRLRNLSSRVRSCRLLEEANGLTNRPRRDVHVPECCREIAVTGEFLNRAQTAPNRYPALASLPLSSWIASRTT
jgi:hypothetical protein